jgi:hypothetical protein
MALSDFYESTIEVVRAYFGFSEFECDPQEITSTLGVVPIEIQRKGEQRTLRNGHEITIPYNSWSIESNSDSKDINVHLRQLLQRLEGLEHRIQAEWKPYFSILWKGNYLYAGSGPFYEHDVLAGIVRCGADLWQDIYQVDDDNATA